MDRDQPTRTPGSSQNAPLEGGPHEGGPHEGGPHEGAPLEGAPYEGVPHEGGGDVYQNAPPQNTEVQASGDTHDAGPAPQSVRPVADNDVGIQAPPAAPAQNPNDLDAIRSERYQRYLKDLRAHEEAREQEPGAQPKRQAPKRKQPAPQQPNAPVAQPPQPPQPPQGQVAQTPPPQPVQGQAPLPGEAPQPPAQNLSEEAIEETIERYMEARPEDVPQSGPRQRPPAQQDPYQENYAAPSNEYRAPEDPAYLYSNEAQQHQPNQPNQQDVWRDDIGGEYDPQGGLYADGQTPVPPKKKRGVFLLLGALLGVAVVGGGVFYAYTQGLHKLGKTNLPVISAEKTPAKVTPKDPGGTKIPQQTKLIYDRIVGDEIVVKEKIVSREEPVLQTPSAPRAPAAPQQATQQPAVPSFPVAVVPAVPQQPSAQRIVTPSVPPPPPSATPDLPQVTITPPGSTPPTPTLAPRVATVPPPPPSLQTPPPTPRARPSVPAPVRTQIPQAPSGPIRLTPPPPPPPNATRTVTAPRSQTPPAPVQAPPPAVGGNEYIIQVASYRSQGEASSAYARLKQRHVALLQNYGPLIQRADLGDKGIYFRLRVGPINGKQAAANLCSSLISAGQKGCIVRKR